MEHSTRHLSLILLGSSLHCARRPSSGIARRPKKESQRVVKAIGIEIVVSYTQLILCTAIVKLDRSRAAPLSKSASLQQRCYIEQ